MSVTSVDIVPQLVRVAVSLDLADYAEVLVADGVDLLSEESRWSLIFADAPAGKWDGLDSTIAALEPGGISLVDDMTPPEFVSDLHRNKTIEVRETLLSDARLRSVEIDWASGLIICARTGCGSWRLPHGSRGSRLACCVRRDGDSLARHRAE